MHKDSGVYGKSKKKQRCGKGERNGWDLQERIGVNSQEEGREVERGRERESERGEVGGCMWVPVRRETAGLSQ